MDKFVIRGGNPLVGTIRVSGAKNSALPCMAAAILTEDEVTLENIPQVRDIETERKLLASMGAEVELGYEPRAASHHHQLPHALRSGCEIRDREDHARQFAGAGPAGRSHGNGARGHAGRLRHRRPAHRSAHQGPGKDGRDHHPGARLPGSARRSGCSGAHLVFDKITVTGTEDLLMAAVLADGETLMENCAREPEVSDLAALLTAMGAKIEGAGTSTIRVQGVSRLHGARYRINPDRIEAGTFLIAGAITGGDLIVANCNPAHLGAVIAKLHEAGARVDDSRSRHGARARRREAARGRHFHRRVSRFPHRHAGAIHGAGHAGRRASAWSKENIFENRFMHVQELVRMGANIKVDGSTATVRGPLALSAAAVMCSDLRASASLVLAALVADGESIIDRVYHMDRGYERIEEKLRGVGAQIRRMGNVFRETEEPAAEVTA